MKTPSLIEMEYAIAVRMGVRQNIIVPNISWGFYIHEMDMAVISKSNCLTEIEIKRTVADFRKDFKKEHNHIDRFDRIRNFYYAMPENVYEKVKNEIPEKAGVIVIYPKQYEWEDRDWYASVKVNARANTKSRKLEDNEVLKLARLGCMRIWKLKQTIIKLKHNENT